MDASSLVLLDQVLAKLAVAGFEPVNADVTIICETPRLAAHMGVMAEVLTEKTGAPVSVKATTTEHLGFLGRGEGIAAMCVALVEER